MSDIKMGWTSWGVKPWWNAVKWWWPREKMKSVQIAIASAIPAALFSVRYGGWEAIKTDAFEVEDSSLNAEESK